MKLLVEIDLLADGMNPSPEEYVEEVEACCEDQNLSCKIKILYRIGDRLF